MASFSDLPNELLLAIGAFLGYPPDILRLTRVNRRLHDLSKTMLYTSISLDSSNYRPSPRSLQQLGQAYPFWGIKYLSLTLAAKPELGLLVRSLNLRLPSNTRVDGFGLKNLLRYMPHLLELHVIVDTYVAGRHVFPTVSMSHSTTPPIPRLSLKYVLPSLKLFSFFSNIEGLLIEESLGYFSALEYLDIQFTYFQPFFDQQNPESICYALPTNLKELKVRCYPGYSLGDFLSEVSLDKLKKSYLRTTIMLLELLTHAPLYMHELRKLCFCFDKLWEDFPDSDPKHMYALLRSEMPRIAKITRLHGTELRLEVVRDATLRTPSGSMLQQHRGMVIDWDD